ncbi:hypothetical protein J7376_08560 [Paracoccus sp. R12_1]|uniref:hypothetical protein n=1 Tax=unclassified Paracoccus (in: a-proteobacteria) TaxID=2688777 RepID=UPI001ADA7F4D|nr:MULTISPECIES: hypothetical protein [unclassified Paracoccus (in: a-proteobacteria)]MBO9456020.1 hypothetical protein [Paracoccus sp. R12_2]MBO9486564.1 hypothetical protein [Paracoccus sp. R12_1]
MISKFSTLTALALTLAAASPAAAYTPQHERPDTYKSVVHDNEKKSVTAGTIHTRAELARLGLKADDVISITVFPSSDRIDPPSRGDL